MTNYLSRFQRRESTLLAPGCCFFCRNNVGPFIDTGSSLPFDGVIYACQTCLVEMYKQLEIPVPESADPEVSYRKGVADTKEKINDLVTSAISNRLLPALTAYVVDSLNDDATLSGSTEDELGSSVSAESSGLESLSLISVGRRDNLSGNSSDGKSAD